MWFGDGGVHRPSLLIVDDDESTRILLEEALHSLGYIHHAGGGEEALEIARRVRPEVVMLDIEMPGMDGYEVCRLLKEDPDTAPASVIFVTSHDDEISEIGSLESGGVDFLSKPLNLLTCRLRVRNHLQLRAHARELDEGRRRLSQLVSQVPTYISYWSSQWLNHYSNDFKGKWFYLNAEQSLGKSLETIVPINLALEIKNRAANLSEGAIIQFESRYQTPQKSLRQVQVDISESTDNHGSKGFLLTIVDVSLLKNAEQELHNEKEKLRVTLNSIGDAVIATDVTGRVTYMNPIAERMTGWHQRGATGQPIEEVMQLRDATSHEVSKNPLYMALKEQRIVGMALNCQLVSASGKVYRVEDSAAPIRGENGTIIGAIIVFHDVSETVAMSMKMSHLAHHDQLTGLPNRVLLQDRLEQAIQVSQSQGLKTAILHIDIDHFKYINDSLGHAAGDELIQLMGERLLSLIDVRSTLSRTGGDEFVLVYASVESVEDIDSLSLKIARAMHEPFVLQGRNYNISASIGISIFPDDATSQDVMMRHADVAMYRAKHEGRNRYCFFSDELKEKLLQRHQLESVLREAIAREQLEVFYQPKIRLDDRAIIGAEALVRLRDDSGNMLSPADFIPVAEDTGLIVALGDIVLKKACRDCALLQKTQPGITVSVNVAAAQVVDDDFYNKVVDTVHDCGLPPGLLELEVTESALMHDVEKVQGMFNRLHEFGVSLALDDFGTGYSSLSYLKKFNLDVLKIDQSFIRDMLTDTNDYDIVQTIVTLGRSLALTLVAEGIEEKEHEDVLQTMNCYAGQGYLYSKPVPFESFRTYLDAAHNSRASLA